MIKRIKAWYTKPREGYIFNVTDYILNDPEAFNITMLMSSIVSVVVMFGISALCFFFIHPFLGVVFAVITLALIRKLYKQIKVGKQFGGVTMTYDRTMGEFVYGGDKSGIKGPSNADDDEPGYEKRRSFKKGFTRNKTKSR